MPGKTTAASIRFQVDGPRLDVLHAVNAGGWHVLMRGLDASLLSAATAGGFTGVTFGPCACLLPAGSTGSQKPDD
ncbi:MAG TPA: arabinosidase [Rhodanobacter sp.]|nr:arabinosidase [Rhodanobacter sp.]